MVVYVLRALEAPCNNRFGWGPKRLGRVGGAGRFGLWGIERYAAGARSTELIPHGWCPSRQLVVRPHLTNDGPCLHQGSLHRENGGVGGGRQPAGGYGTPASGVGCFFWHCHVGMVKLEVVLLGCHALKLSAMAGRTKLHTGKAS